MSLLSAQIDAVRTVQPFRIVGHVEAVAGLTIEAAELPLPLGSLCRIYSLGSRSCLAEVIGFDTDRTLLMPLEPSLGVSRGDAVESIGAAPRVRCSDGLLGRVIDGFGRPIDGLGPLPPGTSRRIDGRSVAPLDRVNIRQPLGTGIRSIDALHTCGLGQRMGIFSGPGVGKSTLIGSIARYTSADVSVVALVGERGREVQEFLQNTLDAESRQRCVVVVSTGDDVPLLKVRAAKVACTIAEHFRDAGRNVLLMMDSLTRLAQAQRQIGLAAREPPATKGFPPSVFALLPEILERAGRTATGSITGFYTVLVEGDDFNEPIPDAVKGISDGHLWLSRALAGKGHYPAIDVLQSISRVRGDVGTPQQNAAARRVLALLASYSEIEDLVNIGAYVRGTSVEHDLAIEWRPKVVEFLRQAPNERCSLEESWKRLIELASAIESAEKQRRGTGN
jgi:flagellum-specific ATP synthase